jgi:hypothetical protein
MGSMKDAMLRPAALNHQYSRLSPVRTQLPQHPRLLGPIPDVTQRLSVGKLERPPRLSKVTLATLGPRPRLPLGLAKVLFLEQRRERQGRFRVLLLMTMDLLGGPRRSQEVRGEDGVDRVVLERFSECFRLLRGDRKK